LLIAPELLATRAEIQRLVAQFQTDCHGEKNLSILNGWRYDLIGKKLIAILAGAKVKIELELKEQSPVKMSL
jgi:ribonuclease D